MHAYVSFAAVLSTTVALSTSAAAQAVSTTNLTCSTKKTLQAAINKVPSGTVGTINVQGACYENVVIPKGKTIVIKGASPAATIVARDPQLAAVRSNGDTTLHSITVTNTSGSAEALAVADRSGYLSLIGSTLSAPNVEAVVAIWGQSGGRIVNSRVTGGTLAVDVWDGSGLRILGTPAESGGPDGYSTVISSPNGEAVSCGIGSSLAIRANVANSADGAVSIMNSKSGIGGYQCSANVANNTTSVSNLAITGISNNGAAVGFWNSSVSLRNVKIADNGGDGVHVNMSDVQIDASSFANNVGGDLKAGSKSTIVVTGWSSQKNSFANASDQDFDCWSGSEIYLSQSSIVQDVGSIADLPTCVNIE